MVLSDCIYPSNCEANSAITAQNPGSPQVLFQVASPQVILVLNLFAATKRSRLQLPYFLSKKLFSQFVSGRGESFNTKRIWDDSVPLRRLMSLANGKGRQLTLICYR